MRNEVSTRLALVWLNRENYPFTKTLVIIKKSSCTAKLQSALKMLILQFNSTSITKRVLTLLFELLLSLMTAVKEGLTLVKYSSSYFNKIRQYCFWGASLVRTSINSTYCI